MTSTATPRPEDYLARFKLSAFRPGQQEVLSAVLAGRDCLCVMPTGSGKSLCYQLPAVMRPGLVLVLSPLIALMKDQVDALQKLGIRATFINSSLDAFEQQLRLQAMAAGEFELVYIAPERLRTPRFLDAIRSVQVQLLAIDEAHCISEWGHDFRPDYARIGRFRERLGFPPTIALTATATAIVRRDVIEQLKLRTPDVFVTGFARPNLCFEVHEPGSPREKDHLLLSILDETSGAGIIYAATRKRCEALVEFLKANKRSALSYHAGLAPDARKSIQEFFMSGEESLIVATNAFGMGIDRRDLRFVIHYNMPGTLEAYYQEAGRAGRDGLPSRCILLFSYADRFVQEFFIENAYPSPDAVRRVYQFLKAQKEDPVELSLQEIKDAVGVPSSSEGVGVCEQILEKCGVLERLDSRQNMGQVKLDSSLPTLVDLLPREATVQRRVLREIEREVGDVRSEWVSIHPQKIAAILEMDRDGLNRALRELAKLPVFHYVPPFRGRAVHMLRKDIPFERLEIDFEALERRKHEELAKLERVIAFAQTRRCRQQEIMSYFGESTSYRCGVCDNCRSKLPAKSATAAPAATSDARVLDAVRMVLSGVARAKGRIGKNLLAKMLCGSRSAQLSKLQLDKLSTFGLLSQLRQTEVVELIESLIKAHLLAQSEIQRFRPIVQLTEMGTLVMRGQEPLPAGFSLDRAICARLPRHAKPHENKAVSAPVQDPNRSQIEPSGESASDETLDSPPVNTTDEKPDHYWTWRLILDGYSIADCLAIRGIDAEQFKEHMALAARDGWEVRAEWLS